MLHSTLVLARDRGPRPDHRERSDRSQYVEIEQRALVFLHTVQQATHSTFPRDHRSQRYAFYVCRDERFFSFFMCSSDQCADARSLEHRRTPELPSVPAAFLASFIRTAHKHVVERCPLCRARVEEPAIVRHKALEFSTGVRFLEALEATRVNLARDTREAHSWRPLHLHL